MIKATAMARDGRRIVVLALSHGNLDRLRADGLNGYIPIKGEDIALPGIDIQITAGETEEKIAEALKPFFGPATVIRGERP